MTRHELLDPPAPLTPAGGHASILDARRLGRPPATALVGLARAHALGALAAARPLALCLDIDGTLAPIAPRPEDARTPEDTLRLLERLARCAHVHVALVTGRAPADARALVPVEGLWIVGNHGAETLAPGASAPEVDPEVAAYGPALARVADALGRLADAPGVLVEDKRWSVSLHTRLARPEVGEAAIAAARALGEAEGLRVDAGKAVLEFKAPVPVDKGTATLALLARWGVTGPAADERAAVLAAGDDTTDEYLFHALHGTVLTACTVCVGDHHPTWAEYRVDAPPALAAFLADLADAIES